MKKNLLGLALLSAVGFSQAAAAQEFDDRWYISGTLGVLVTDSDRLDASNSELYGVGVGKRSFTPAQIAAFAKICGKPVKGI